MTIGFTVPVAVTLARIAPWSIETLSNRIAGAALVADRSCRQIAAAAIEMLTSTTAVAILPILAPARVGCWGAAAAVVIGLGQMHPAFRMSTDAREPRLRRGRRRSVACPDAKFACQPYRSRKSCARPAQTLVRGGRSDRSSRSSQPGTGSAPRIDHAKHFTSGPKARRLDRGDAG